MTETAPSHDVSDLRVEERVSLLSGSSMWTTSGVERLGIRPVVMSDGPHGIRRQPEGGDHLGIGHSLPATCFPPAVALGSSWDPELARSVGIALGREAAARGVDVLLGPGVNIKRSPLCGRNFEYFSEDPHLSGTLGAAYVEGVQSRGIGTSLKHFAANNQETDRFRIDALVDERALREIYLAAFERVIRDADPWTVMAAYNRLNGVPCTEHRWLLTEVLRDEWRYEGVVVSDWGAVEDSVAAVAAGLDLEMPSSNGLSAQAVLEALREGALEPQVVDRSARRLLRLVARCRPRDAAEVDPEDHHRLAREAAAQCAVLLRNDGVLPLEPTSNLAVVGELARTPRYQGAGSSHVVPTRLEDPLSELRRLTNNDIEFAPGYRLDGEHDRRLEQEAIDLARQHSVCLLFLGLPEGVESEGYDRESLELPPAQLALLDGVLSTGTTVVVVLSNGSVVSLDPWCDRVAAILEGWLLGQAGGGAIADLLLGAANPSGRLAETIPIRLQDTASFLNFPGEAHTVRYGEGIFVGYRFHDAVGGPVRYPFGHGLSYTTFEYSELEVTVAGSDRDLRIAVSALVGNAGDRSGQEVAQLYVSAPSAEVARPPRELKGFAKVPLDPGESTVVRFDLTWRDFAYFHPTSRRWVTEPGPVEVALGASSRDLRLSTSFELPVLSPKPVLSPDSTLAEWLAVPRGRAVLEREMALPDGSANRFLLDEYVRTVGSVSLRRLARFPAAHVDGSRLEALAAEANEVSEA